MKSTIHEHQKTINNNVRKTIIYSIAIMSLLAILTSCTADELETKKEPVVTEIDPPTNPIKK